MKRTPKATFPQRSYRRVRVESESFNLVLAKVNGTIRGDLEALRIERAEVRKVFDRIISYCDRLESVLIDSVDQGQKIPRRERIRWALVNIAHREFSRMFDPLIDSLKAESFGVAVMVLRDKADATERIVDSWKASVVPPADQLFKARRLLIIPDPLNGGHIGVQFLWDVLHRIIELDDLRRIRRCSGFHGDQPIYLLRIKIQRQERYFCSDQCRSRYNYNKEGQGEKQHGRQHSRKAKR